MTDFRSDKHETPDGFIETGTVIHEGREYTSGGAFVSDDYLVAYPDGCGNLKDWQGNTIGSYTVTNSRKAIFFGRFSWQGSHYYYMRATLPDGRQYALRGFGAGMIAKGKHVKGAAQ